MAFMLAIVPDRKLYTQLLTFTNKTDLSDDEFRRGLRLFLAIGVSGWLAKTPVEKVKPIEDVLTDIVIDEHFFEKGFIKTHQNHRDERLWFCSYIGAEKVTSKYMKENHPDVRGVICMRLYNSDVLNNELDSHTVQLYF